MPLWTDWAFPLGLIGFIVFVYIVIVGSSNAVNLTDGVDGLATGVTIPVMLFYVAVSAWYGRSDLITAAAAMAGGCPPS